VRWWFERDGRRGLSFLIFEGKVNDGKDEPGSDSCDEGPLPPSKREGDLVDGGAEAAHAETRLDAGLRLLG